MDGWMIIVVVVQEEGLIIVVNTLLSAFYLSINKGNKIIAGWRDLLPKMIGK